jgi:hypothetical protein
MTVSEHLDSVLKLFGTEVVREEIARLLGLKMDSPLVDIVYKVWGNRGSIESTIEFLDKEYTGVIR